MYGLKTRAIYLPDIKCEEVPIFELRESYFVNINDTEMRYESEIVLCDDDWIIVSIDEDEENKIANVRY